jgi:hypothetical protein
MQVTGRRRGETGDDGHWALEKCGFRRNWAGKARRT